MKSIVWNNYMAISGEERLNQCPSNFKIIGLPPPEERDLTEKEEQERRPSWLLFVICLYTTLCSTTGARQHRLSLFLHLKNNRKKF